MHVYFLFTCLSNRRNKSVDNFVSIHDKPSEIVDDFIYLCGARLL